MRRAILILGAFFVVAGCGVRGDPIPPGTPAELGRGKPNYKRATEDLAFPGNTPPTPEPEDEEDGGD
ncbi:MAG: hypothetical protein ABL958_08940 [Bdellovibrionia bacterium]